MKSYDPLLAHWLPVTSIFLVILRLSCNQFGCYYLENKKNFSQFSAPFLKSTSNFRLFEKKTTLIAHVFRKLQNAKDFVRPMSKKSSSEHPSTVNMLKGLNDYEIFMTALLSTLFITVNQADFENVSLSDMWNPRALCQHNDSRWQLFSSGYWEFAATYSNAIT